MHSKGLVFCQIQGPLVTFYVTERNREPTTLDWRRPLLVSPSRD